METLPQLLPLGFPSSLSGADQINADRQSQPWSRRPEIHAGQTKPLCVPDSDQSMERGEPGLFPRRPRRLRVDANKQERWRGRGRGRGPPDKTVAAGKRAAVEGGEVEAGSGAGMRGGGAAGGFQGGPRRMTKKPP